jgi:hypothetical protein
VPSAFLETWSRNLSAMSLMGTESVTAVLLPGRHLREGGDGGSGDNPVELSATICRVTG